jgi:hypothetical protein
MNDSHVSLVDLAYGGFVDMAAYIINGFYPDPTSGSFLPAPGYTYYFDPETYQYVWVVIPNTWDGNPNGAQEWRGDHWDPGHLYGGNYCAANYTCKARLGNVGGNSPTPASTCPAQDTMLYNDNFFWGRKP